MDAEFDDENLSGASRAITELELANIIPELTLDADLLALDVGADPTVLAREITEVGGMQKIGPT